MAFLRGGSLSTAWSVRARSKNGLRRLNPHSKGSSRVEGGGAGIAGSASAACSCSKSGMPFAIKKAFMSLLHGVSTVKAP